jgi:hypothetical protein
MTTCVLNFHPDFAPLIEAGVKPHTIRALRADGLDPLPGDTLHLYTGLSTGGRRLLRREVCEFAVEIRIQHSASNVHHVLLGGQPLSQAEIETLARVDGFAHSSALVEYFAKNYGLPFNGLLIGWQPEPVYVTRH